MSFIERLFYWQMEQPKMFSAFHLIFAISIYLFTALMVFLFKDAKRRTIKIITLIVWIILIIMEVFKQLIYAYNGNGVLIYNWNVFPFQFCEMPLYVIPIFLINRNKTFENILTAFFATFIMFAGLAIFTLPFTGLAINVFLNARTMLGHGLQFMLGTLLFAWNRKNMNIKNFFLGSIIFIIGVIIAIALNTIIDPRVPQKVNMFFLNPNYETTLLIIKHIQPHVHWIIFDLLYIVCFYIIAFTTLVVEHLVWALCVFLSKKIKCKKNQVELKN